MKLLSKKGFLQKTIIAILFVLCINFIVPTYSHADFGGVLFDPIADFLCTIGDAVINVLQKCMTGDWGSGFKLNGGFLVQDNEYRDWDKNIPSGAVSEEVSPNEFTKGWLGLGNHYYIPVATYSPEQIFSNNVSGLDINFVNPKFSEDDGGSAARLQKTIASWYVALRNLATVGLLSILVYVGIRIIISSTASDKAKYKQFLMDWLIALLILFFLHYIMAFTVTMVENVTNALNKGGTSSVVIKDTEKGKSFATNLLGAARFKTQYKDFGEKVTYLIMYLALVVYTCIFTYFYLRRLLMMAFLTLIAPLVALTYPIDKMGDSKAQAFNSWLKEYVFNALIQPFHLIIYMVFVGSAMDLAKSNVIYMIAALGFILPAEKILRGFFGFNQASSTLGALVGGAAIGQFIGKGAKSFIGGGSGGKKPSGGSSSGSQEASKPLRFDKKHGIGEVDAPDASIGAATGAGAAIAGAQLGAGDELPRTPQNVFGDESKSNLDANEQMEFNALGSKLDQMEESGDAWSDPVRAREFEDAQRRYQELQNKKNAQISQQSQEQAPTQASTEKLQNSRFTNWRRAHGITAAGAGRFAGRNITRAARFATRTAFKAGTGTLAAAVAMASGGGLAGGAAAFTVGANVGGTIGDKVAGAVPTIARGAVRTGAATVGLGRAAGAGISEGARTRSINAGLEAARNSRGMRQATRAAFEGTRLGREMDLANGNRNYEQAGAIASFKTNKENIQYLKDQMTANGWKDENGNEYAAGNIPSDKDVKNRMDTFDEYISEGVTDIKQIMNAQKAEDYGVSAKQAAIISSIAKDRGINEEVLLDDKKYNQKRTKLVGDHLNKGYSQQEAQAKADYILEVAKVQNGVRTEKLQKTTKTKHPEQPKTNNNTTARTGNNTTNNTGNTTRNTTRNTTSSNIRTNNNTGNNGNNNPTQTPRTRNNK